jgi:gluconate 2-dehydrogenase gamma chain
MFFNAAETRTLDAVTARVMPSEPDGLGAREAGVVIYIDRAVAGYFRDLQGIYRVGLQRLDECCRAGYGKAFADLTNAEQDETLLAVEGSGGQPVSPEAKAMLAADRRETILARFFAIVREHTIQGMFCDPLYGGNRDFTGWKLIGFPGAQWGYTAEQMREGFDATTIPILSLSDLQRTRTGSHNG